MSFLSATSLAYRQLNTRLRVLMALGFALVACLSTNAFPASAQTEIEVFPLVEYQFGQEVIFRAEVASDLPITAAMVFYRTEGRTETGSGPARLLADGRFEYHLAPEQAGLRAFARVDYWFQLSFEGGTDVTSQTYSFQYLDNRFEWKTLEGSVFQVHWYEGDAAFAQLVADIAGEGFARAQTLLPVSLPEKVDFYIYASMQEMQATLGSTRNGWEAGHADPDLGVAVISLPEGPDQRFLAEQRVPHELMHIMLFHLAGTGYNSLPTWFSEGMASLNELYPDPDYQILLENAVRKDALIPIVQLCASFPVDNSGALLSYAESFDFTRYIYRQYGASALEALLYSYADGLGCARGAETALGISLDQIEQPWVASLMSAKPAEKPTSELIAWSTLLGVVLLVPSVAVLVALLSRRGRHATESVPLSKARSSVHG